MSMKDRGRLGGKATFEKYGKDHMAKIASLGGTAMWKKYKLVPVGTSQFALVYRETNKIRRIFNQLPSWAEHVRENNHEPEQTPDTTFPF